MRVRSVFQIYYFAPSYNATQLFSSSTTEQIPENPPSGGDGGNGGGMSGVGIFFLM
jgi:hypothetical protein